MDELRQLPHGGHTNHRLSDTLGDGQYGAPKRVLSLLGVADTKPWAWDGQIRQLEDQVEKSVRTTLRGRDLEDREVDDLAAYLRTLELPEVSEPGETALIAAGRKRSTATPATAATPLRSTPHRERTTWDSRTRWATTGSIRPRCGG